MPPLVVGIFFNCTLYSTLKLTNYVHAHIFTIVFWLQVRPPPGFQPLPIKQEPKDEDSTGAAPMLEPAVMGGMQEGVAPIDSHPVQEEPAKPTGRTDTPAPGVSGFNCCTPLLPCTVQCNHC